MTNHSNKLGRSKQKELEQYQGDYIIPIMGPTGSGKSSFINRLIGEDVVAVGYSLKSCTNELKPVEVPARLLKENLPSWKPASLDPARKLIIVDTPGFNDTSADDADILKRLAEWLAASHGVGAKLAGVIYLQDISQDRVTGAGKRNFEVFCKLCGGPACKSVVFGTTKWGRIHADDRKIAEERELELRDQFWDDMVRKGSTVQRVDDESTDASPWSLVETVLFMGQSPVLQIQAELMQMHKSLPQTEAAQVLRKRIEELIKSLRNAGATKEDVQALTLEVEALKEKGRIARFFERFFG